jgi:CheY-like chemotaxis protein
VDRRHKLLPIRTGKMSPSGCKILVLDDDLALVGLTTRILNDAGFRTFGTTDPHEALRLIKTVASIKLLISDVMMPRITGPEIVRQAQNIRQGSLHVLFMTGGFDGVEFRKTDRILEKPWSCDELLNAVQGALSQEPEDVEWTGPERRREAA